MKSIAGRTTLWITIVMCCVLVASVSYLKLNFKQVLEEQAQLEFSFWWQQNNQPDFLAVVKGTEPSVTNGDFFILGLTQVEESGDLTPLEIAVQPEWIHPLVSVWHTDRLGTFIVDVWSPQLASLHQLQRKMLIGAIFMAGLGVLTAWIFLVRSLNPVHDLISQASRLTQGSFEQHFDMTGSREVEALANVFEQIRLRFRQVVSGAITQAMIWEGQLDLFPMSQLLIMLRFTAQTGVLVVMEGNNLGRICFQDGQIQGAFYKEQKGFTAFYAMFLLPIGSFKFNPKMRQFRDELSVVSWYSVLLYAARRVTSLRLIEQYVPDQRFVAQKAQLGSELDLIQTDLTLPEWELYDAIDGQSSVRELARTLHWTAERVQRYLYRFAVVGLIETQLSEMTEPPPDNVVSLWARAAWNRRSGGVN